MLLTIFTPTYNRAHLLPRLYESLKIQTVKNFEWLIVDDGSTDDTENLVTCWIDTETSFPIRYLYQKNQGKYIAHNTGVLHAAGDLFFCVDSDDQLPPRAAEIIADKSKLLETFDGKISGIMGLKSDIQGNMLGDLRRISNISILSPHDLYSKHHFLGELSLVYFTSVLRQFLFPEIPGSKFITEGLIYNRIDRSDYKMLLLDEILTICEYTSDGYSYNISKFMRENPTGFKIYWMEKIDMETEFRYLLPAIINYHRYSYLSDDTTHFYDGKYRFIVSIFRPLGIAISVIMSTKFGTCFLERVMKVSKSSIKKVLTKSDGVL